MSIRRSIKKSIALAEAGEMVPKDDKEPVPSRRGFFKRLAQEPVKQALTQHLAGQVIKQALQPAAPKPPLPPHEIDRPHLSSMMQHISKLRGASNLRNPADLSYYPDMGAWWDAGTEMHGFHSKKLGGHVVYQDHATEDQSSPSPFYSAPRHRGYNNKKHDVYFKPDGSNEIQHHQVHIDIGESPNVDDFDHPESVMHQWYKKKLEKGFPKPADLVDRHVGSAPPGRVPWKDKTHFSDHTHELLKSSGFTDHYEVAGEGDLTNQPVSAHLKHPSSLHDQLNSQDYYPAIHFYHRHDMGEDSYHPEETGHVVMLQPHTGLWNVDKVGAPVSSHNASGRGESSLIKHLMSRLPEKDSGGRS